ncbi:MAG: helix-turn-helix transcriptional regulator [Thermoplasmata archaeon]|nr:helix-turn-helix transcriptional regulator [Thermoplasmata archaeon]
MPTVPSHPAGPGDRFVDSTGRRVPCAEESGAMCPVVAAINVIGTEWRLAIIHRLLEGPQRFSELLRSNPHLNAKTLSATLKFLQGSGVVQRNVVSTQPFVVVYSLTEMGLGLAPAARELRDWGLRWLRPRAPVDSGRMPLASHDIEPAIPAHLPTSAPPSHVQVPAEASPGARRREAPVRRTVSRSLPPRFK